MIRQTSQNALSTWRNVANRRLCNSGVYLGRNFGLVSNEQSPSVIRSKGTRNVTGGKTDGVTAERKGDSMRVSS
jgi:hypothetical protein